MDRTAAFADATPLSFWLDDPTAPEPAPPLVGPAPGRPGGGRRRLHRAVGGPAGQAGRPVARRRAARGRPVRVGGVGPQRRLLRGQPHPRAGQRRRAVPRRGRRPRAARPATTSTPSRPTVADLGHRLRLRAHRRARRRHRAPPGGVAARGRGPGPRARRRRRSSSTGTSCRPTSTPPPSWPGCGTRTSCALVNPARLAWGLRGACEAAGVRVHEHTRVDGLESDRPGHRGPDGRAHHPRPGRPPPGWCSATNASPSPVRRLRKYVVPVYDYVLMTEPLDPAQREAIGWARRQGIGSTGNQFLYFRQTADHRILFGGYDAVYHYGNAMGPSLEQRPATFAAAVDPLRPRRSRSSRTSGSPTPGPAPSTPARGSAPSSTAPSTAGWPRRPATPASASGRRASAPGSPSTWCPGPRPS